MYDTGLANRIRARGITVVEVAGWQTRGSSVFSPKGAVNHHTAGSANGNAPSLAICTYGRSDLPGPLCHVLLGRDLVAYVIAAGRANHAGLGDWAGLVGNSSVHGLEIEHVGSGISPAQLHVAVKIHAAFLEAPGSTRDASKVCQHFEWAPERKIDFRALNPPYTANSFRSAIATELNSEDGFLMALTDAEQREIYTQICAPASSGESRLGEVTVIARRLDDEIPRAAGNHLTVQDGVKSALNSHAKAEAEARAKAGTEQAMNDRMTAIENKLDQILAALEGQ